MPGDPGDPGGPTSGEADVPGDPRATSDGAGRVSGDPEPMPGDPEPMPGDPEPMPGLVIRPTEPADADALAEIYLSLARHHAALAPGRYRVPDRDAVRARFALIAGDADPDNLHLVALVDGRAVGQLDAWSESPSGPGGTRVPMASASAGLAVLDEFRGRGIGTALVTTAEEWARGRGLAELRLEVAIENDAARRLYERLGYAPTSTWLAKPIA